MQVILVMQQLIEARMVVYQMELVRYIGGGYREPSSPHFSDVMDYVDIAQTGNAIDFGDLSNASRVMQVSIQQLVVYLVSLIPLVIFLNL